jgi:hypothetical protein
MIVGWERSDLGEHGELLIVRRTLGFTGAYRGNSLTDTSRDLALERKKSLD